MQESVGLIENVVSALDSNHAGRSAYADPGQSPSNNDANPGGPNGIGEAAKDKRVQQYLNGVHLPGRNGMPAPIEQKGQLELPPSQANQEPLISSTIKEDPPHLPVRPSSKLPDRPPEPTPDSTRAAPTLPPRQPTTLPNPAIDEDLPTSEEGDSQKYTRDPQRLIAYLIPLPKPKLSKSTASEDSLPDRFLLYTPPPPHLLKPAKGIKEPKLQWCKRKLQQEVQKANKYDGKTVSWRGLHSKTTKGVMWAIRHIKATDIVFLGRIKNNEVDEIILVFPSSVTHTIPEVRSNFIAQVTRTKKKASKEAVISTILLPVTLAIDTFAAVIWPFGGLFEIDAVWAYASIKGWNTSRVITKRLGARESKFGKYGGTERVLHLRFQQDEKMDVLTRSLAEACHKKNPQMFDSVGRPPTETEVTKAIGWTPVVRGSTGGVRNEGETGWDDEEWQRVVFRDDFKATMKKGAGSWEKWCKKFEKSPEKALKK
ncbi:hypothetical protein BP5796_13172 [Coleophoma crateriformis]|uniref:Secreted protein n=1 Tax=Coleophoma crateriformis TaxID=565419 RepID=A0A3D8Q3G5_9HELO|nr:hypothetical protein BP5796_13172 [Coleophoma crateriformis]